MRSLAHIEIIDDIRPIEGADRIEVAQILGWEVVVRKDEGYKVGDKVVYIEIDSILDSNNPIFSFMESKKFKVKTIKLRGQISQGLIMPMSILPTNRNYEVGEDVTKVLKIKQIEDEVPKVNTQGHYAALKKSRPRLVNNPIVQRMLKYEWFRTWFFNHFAPKKKAWPYWVSHTDEVRIQGKPMLLLNKEPMIVTEKIDGMSATYTWHKEGNKKPTFTICSRRIVIKEEEVNPYNIIAKQYNILEVLVNIAKLMDAQSEVTLQGEIIGEGIQKNKYRITGYDFYGFNLFIDGKKIPSTQAAGILMSKGVNWVPILETEYILPDTVQELLDYATAQSKLHNTLREGVVIRSHDNKISFKAVSNEFLDYWNI